MDGNYKEPFYRETRQGQRRVGSPVPPTRGEGRGATCPKPLLFLKPSVQPTLVHRVGALTPHCRKFASS